MRVTRVRREIVRVLMLVAITSLVPLPVRADDTPSQRPAPTIKASAAAIVARDVAAVPVRGARVRRADQGTTSTTGSTSFFKTRPGIIALTVMAVGTGYAVYSAQHDRIHSAGKK